MLQYTEFLKYFQIMALFLERILRENLSLMEDTSLQIERSHIPAKKSHKVTYQLKLPSRYKIHPTFHVSLLKPFSPSTTEEASIYQVQEILNSWRRSARLEYLVDWEGYGPEERSWVARDDILDPLLLEEFHQNHPNRPALRGRGRPRRVRASGAAPGGGGNVRELGFGRACDGQTDMDIWRNGQMDGGREGGMWIF